MTKKIASLLAASPEQNCATGSELEGHVLMKDRVKGMCPEFSRKRARKCSLYWWENRQEKNYNNYKNSVPSSVTKCYPNIHSSSQFANPWSWPNWCSHSLPLPPASLPREASTSSACSWTASLLVGRSAGTNHEKKGNLLLTDTCRCFLIADKNQTSAGCQANELFMGLPPPAGNIFSLLCACEIEI